MIYTQHCIYTSQDKIFFENTTDFNGDTMYAGKM